MAESESQSYAASVIVCTYRREKVLCDTLEQLIEQSTGDYEIVIVDQTPEHILETVRYLRHVQQRAEVQYYQRDSPGLPAARNWGCSVAQSEILIFCDDDVILCERFVQRYLECFRGFPEVAAIAGQVLNRGEVPSDAPGMFYHNAPIARFFSLYGANFGIRKSAYQAVGGIDPSLGVHAYTEDRVLALELRDHQFQIRYEPSISVQHLADPVGGCRITDLSQSTSESEKSYSKLFLFYRYLDLPRNERWKTYKDALRQGPLRRYVILRPWLWPNAWWGFFRASRNAKLAAIESRQSRSSFTGD